MSGGCSSPQRFRRQQHPPPPPRAARACITPETNVSWSVSEHRCFEMQPLGSSGGPYPGLLLSQSGRRKASWTLQIDSSAQSPVALGCPTRLAEDIHLQGWPPQLGLPYLPGPLLHFAPVRLCKKHGLWNLAQMLIPYPVLINYMTLCALLNLFEPKFFRS